MKPDLQFNAHQLYIKQQKNNKMKLSRIIRRMMPITPMRAGVPPLWDRPDPPNTVHTEAKRRFTEEEKHFSLQDGSSPTYMMIQPEIAEGDPLEALPLFLQRIAILFGFAIFIGGFGYIYGNKQQNETLYNYETQVENLQRLKKQVETKYGLKDIVNNPFKLNAWPEVFPKHAYYCDALTDEYKEKVETVDKIRKTNGEALTYWNALYAECEKHVKEHPFGSSHH